MDSRNVQVSFPVLNLYTLFLFPLFYLSSFLLSFIRLARGCGLRASLDSNTNCAVKHLHWRSSLKYPHWSILTEASSLMCTSWGALCSRRTTKALEQDAEEVDLKRLADSRKRPNQRELVRQTMSRQERRQRKGRRRARRPEEKTKESRCRSKMVCWSKMLVEDVSGRRIGRERVWQRLPETTREFRPGNASLKYAEEVGSLRAAAAKMVREGASWPFNWPHSRPSLMARRTHFLNWFSSFFAERCSVYLGVSSGIATSKSISRLVNHCSTLCSRDVRTTRFSHHDVHWPTCNKVGTTKLVQTLYRVHTVNLPHEPADGLLLHRLSMKTDSRGFFSRSFY